jgi:predicted phosphodiesterase
MRIRLLSDLHTELYPIILNFKKSADVVILAGDIGNPYHDDYINLLRKLALTHQKVFVISGNHEYYHHKIDETDIHIHDLCDDNIHFLQKESIVYDNVNLWGVHYGQILPILRYVNI